MFLQLKVQAKQTIPLKTSQLNSLNSMSCITLLNRELEKTVQNHQIEHQKQCFYDENEINIRYRLKRRKKVH